MRLIDADALREIVEDGLRNNPHKYGYTRAFHRSEYKHFLDVVQHMPTIALPPNEPLTLEELREMDGEPVWVVPLDGRNNSGWMLVDMRYGICQEAHGGIVMLRSYGKTWLAYRRKPEEVQYDT